jgi:hypothetical protein
MASFNSNVAIRIAADFIGLPAFKKADTAVDKLYKSTKKLAGAFGVTFSAVAITRFAANSIRAFAAEERQIAALTTTVKNLGLAFQAPVVNDYIEDLERLTGIGREQLQPAFQKLITQTGDIAKAQKILRAALDVSFSGLMSVEEAAGILTQAYVGNRKGLRQLNLGFTTTQLAAMDFEEVLKQIGETYKGSTKAALDGTKAKLDRLNIAAGNAKENIGGGLVDAFANLAGNGDLEKSNQWLEDMGQNIANILRSVTSGGWKSFINFLNPASTSGFSNPTASSRPSFGSPAQWRAQNKAILKAQEDAAKKLRQEEQKRLDALRKQTAEKRAQAAIDKANKVLTEGKGMFDLEGIQLAAALQGKLTEEQRSRVETLQKIWELEQAIQAGNTALIEKLTSQLQLLIKQTEELNTQSQALLLIKNILGSLDYNKSLFDLNNITSAMALLNQMSGLSYKPSDLLTVPNLPQIYDIMIRDLPNAAAEDVVDMMPEININITENARKLIDVIYDTVTEQSASGNPPIVTRVGTSLAW